MSEIDPILRAVRCFRSRFDADPTVVATAPGRVNLIGEHVDHRGGVVLPFAIDRRVAIAMGRATDDRTTIVADDLDLASSWPGPPPTRPIDDERHAFANHLLGVVDALRPGGDPAVVPPLSITIASDLPPGGGLSSSAAIEVATGLAFTATCNLATPDTLALALAAQKAEHDWVGTPCGMMDMLASAGGRQGRILRIDCTSFEVGDLPAPPSEAFAFVLLDSGVRHRLADGGYASRLASLDRVESIIGRPLRDASPADLELPAIDEVDRRRGRHVITEMARVDAAISALDRLDLETLGDLMFRSHESLRDDFAVSTPELDRLVDAARRHRGSGVLGARMTGGGFGGWVVMLLERSSMAQVLADTSRSFEKGFGRRPDHLEVRPSDGARIEATR